MNSLGQSTEIKELTSLRGILAWWVVFSHLLTYTGFPPESTNGLVRLVGKGSIAVDVFIILSGFVIFNLLDGRKETYKHFITRRFLRLFPVFFVFLMFSIVIERIVLSAYLAWPHATPLVKTLLVNSTEDFPARLVSHLTMLHGLIPDVLLPNNGMALLPPSWSVSLEWQYYLVAPLMVYCINHRNAKYFLGLIAGMLLLNFIPHGRIWGAPALPEKLAFFGIGMASNYLWRRRDELTAQFGRFKRLIAAGACIAICMAHSLPLFIWSFFFFLAWTAELPSSSPWVSGLRRALHNRIAQWFGTVSYSIYMVHSVVLFAVTYGLLNYYPSIRPVPMLFWLTLISLPVVLVISYFSHRWIEKPFIALGKRLVAPKVKVAEKRDALSEIPTERPTLVSVAAGSTKNANSPRLPLVFQVREIETGATSYSAQNLAPQHQGQFSFSFPVYNSESQAGFDDLLFDEDTADLAETHAFPIEGVSQPVPTLWPQTLSATDCSAKVTTLLTTKKV